MTDPTAGGRDGTGPIITVPGNYQTALGAPVDWDPADVNSAVTDPDGDGVYTRTVFGLPAGDYRAKVTHGLSWTENYGAGGVPGGADIEFSIPAGWDAPARTDFRYDIGTHVLTVISRPVPTTADLAERSGQWIRRDVVAWDLPVEAMTDGWTVRLHAAPDGGLLLEGARVVGGSAISLDVDASGLPAAVVAQWPHLVGYEALRLRPGDADPAALGSLLTGQVVVVAYDGDGFVVAATGLQIPGVLDDLFDATDRDLGVGWDGAIPTLAVWAPTARRVALALRDPSGVESTHEMTGDDDGVWAVTGRTRLGRQQLPLRGRGVRPELDAVVTNLVTDPYCIALTTNSARSVLVDLDDRRARSRPAGIGCASPPLRAARGLGDLRAARPRLLDRRRHRARPRTAARTCAFTDTGSDGMQHLRGARRRRA